MSINVTDVINNDITTNSVTTYSIFETNSDDINETLALDRLSPTQSILNESLNDNRTTNYELQIITPLFEAFAWAEIVMTTVELIIAFIGVCKIPRWKKNYRNQMLIQLSLARFIKRVISYVVFQEEKHKGASRTKVDIVLFGAQTYIDFVIVILVIFFIKHMYDSLIVVIVKINQDTLYKVLSCTWLLPLPLSAAWAGIVVAKVLDKWLAYLLICCLFRWPLILSGTILYVTILCRVFTDKIKKFARSLTVITFLLCLVVNLYLFSKDVIELWCFKSIVTVLVNHVLGFILNLLILIFYSLLIILNYKKKSKSTTSIPD